MHEAMMSPKELFTALLAKFIAFYAIPKPMNEGMAEEIINTLMGHLTDEDWTNVMDRPPREKHALARYEAHRSLISRCFKEATSIAMEAMSEAEVAFEDGLFHQLEEQGDL